jgi:membrane fusion protein (multidrug efflux system)
MLSGQKFWVEANYKESQLRYMRLGQAATVTIDAFPDVELKGHVDTFSPGTGSSFSVLPPENATGNWVKVTQRVPVQIALDAVPQGLPLHAGLSVEVTVDTGHQRRLIGKDTPPAEPRRTAANAQVSARKP